MAPRDAERLSSHADEGFFVRWKVVKTMTVLQRELEHDTRRSESSVAQNGALMTTDR
ncbi:MAG: hypothetical protein H0V47_17075 [Chloroflexia bacterium]|nr:hypothetical protein [Chloroflexia bacterium]